MSELSTTKSDGVEIISPATLSQRAPQFITMVAAEEEAESQIDIRRLLRRYAWLALSLAILGTLGGFVSVILATPMYRSRLLLDIQPIRSMDRASGAAAAEETMLQTQMLLIRSAGFVNRVINRMQSETLPVAPVRNDFFTKLRTKLRPEMRNSAQLMTDGIQTAVANLQVRPVNGTTLLEISCESIHPELAANFANTVGSEFIDQSMQSRSIDAQRTGQWLAAQVEETKSKLREAEDKLQEFVRNSGNLFVSSDTTLADSDLRTFQSQMAAAKAERIAKQSQFEFLKNAKPDDRADLLPDGFVRNLQSRLMELKQQRVLLTDKYTPNHYKVQQLDLQIRELEASISKETGKAYERAKTDFEAAQRRERLIGGAYSSAAGQVSSQAGQAAQYAALRREVDILRQTYSQILMQASQTSITNALPQSNMKVVDMATAAQEPLKPKPAMNMAFGTLLGVVASVGIAFLRERMDRSVKQPGSARELLNARELGVIPNLSSIEPPTKGVRVRIALQGGPGNLMRGALKPRPANQEKSGELIGWQEKNYFSESFRHTVASLLRGESQHSKVGAILLTSPNPSEGKTLVTSNLGISLAETGRRVLLIDADFRRPRLHQVFQLENDNTGLGPLLKTALEGGEYDLDAALQSTEFPGLSVLVNGPQLNDLSRLLHSSALPELMRRLRERFDIILVDAPPVIQIVDARIMHQMVDGVVLVLRSGVTDRKSALEAYRYLHEDGAQLLGTILNDWHPHRSKVNHYYQYVREEAESVSSRGHSGNSKRDSSL